MKDFFGVPICVVDLVVYGKSSRERPMNVGEVLITDEKAGNWGEMTVKGVKNSKPGTLSGYQISDRIGVLPDSYRRFM